MLPYLIFAMDKKGQYYLLVVLSVIIGTHNQEDISMWLNILSQELRQGHIHRKRQETKWQWQMHNTELHGYIKGEKEYEGKLLEARQSDEGNLFY